MSPPALTKILMTADTAGGVWTFTMDLCAALSRRGVAVTLVTMGGLPDEAQRVQADALDIALVATDYRLEWMRDCESDLIESGRMLLSLADGLKPDLVHANGYYHACLPFDAPVLLTAHSCVSSWWHACKGEAIPAEWRWYRETVASAVCAANVLVAPTAAYLAEFQRLHGAAKRSRVIRNGRNPGCVSPQPKKRIVLAAGRLWDEAKNIGILCRAASGLDMPIAVAGDCTSPEGQPVRLTNVIALGRLNSQKLSEAMSTALVFAAPARYEPFGLSILEAALHGCALVLADIPTLRELWDRAAIFVHPDDVAGWHDAFARLSSQPEFASAYAAEARKRARKYSVERMVDAYMQQYSALMSDCHSANLGVAA
jgi:glycogen(starch) synthase